MVGIYPPYNNHLAPENRPVFQPSIFRSQVQMDSSQASLAATAQLRLGAIATMDGPTVDGSEIWLISCGW